MPTKTKRPSLTNAAKKRLADDPRLQEIHDTLCPKGPGLPIKRDAESEAAEKDFGKTYGGKAGEQHLEIDRRKERNHGAQEEFRSQLKQREQSREAKRLANEDGLAAEMDDKTREQMVRDEVARLRSQDPHAVPWKIAQQARENVAARLHPETKDDEEMTGADWKPDDLDEQSQIANAEFERLSAGEMKGAPIYKIQLAAEDFAAAEILQRRNAKDAEDADEPGRLPGENENYETPDDPLGIGDNGPDDDDDESDDGSDVDDDEVANPSELEREDNSEEWDFANRQREADKVVPIVPDMPPVTKGKTGVKQKGTKAAKEGGTIIVPATSGRPSVLSTNSTQTLTLLKLGQIKPSPLNPRKHFDPVKLAELGELIKKQGFIQKIEVRPIRFELGSRKGEVDYYELLDGERRWRAAQMAEIVEALCIVREMSDEDALALRGIAGMTNESLNPIERAIWCQMMTKDKAEGGGGFTQTALAEQFHLSQPWIANQIRLLKLPESLQDLVIRQQITPAHALAVVPYAEHPELLPEIEKNLRDDIKYDRLQSAKDYANDLIRDVGNFQSLTGYDHGGKTGSVHWQIVPTAEEAEQLRLIEVKPWPGASAKEHVQIALNTKLWKKLRARAIVDAKAGVKPKPVKATKGKGSPPKKASPAEEKAKAKRSADAFKLELDEWKGVWLRYLCAGKLRELEDGRAKIDAGRQSGILVKLILHFHFEGDFMGDFALDRGLKATGLKNVADHRGFYHCVRELPHDKLGALCVTMLAEWLYPSDRGASVAHGIEFDLPGLEELAQDLHVDREAAWRKEQAGPLTNQFFELYEKDQLVTLAKEMGHHFVTPEREKTDGMIKTLMQSHRHLRMPKVLQPPKAKATSAKQKTAKVAKKKGRR